MLWGYQSPLSSIKSLIKWWIIQSIFFVTEVCQNDLNPSLFDHDLTFDTASNLVSVNRCWNVLMWWFYINGHIFFENQLNGLKLQNLDTNQFIICKVPKGVYVRYATADEFMTFCENKAILRPSNKQIQQLFCL